MTDFWKDRAPTAAETGAHLSNPANALELALSHLAFAVTALDPMSLSDNDRERVGVLIDKLTASIGETK